MTTLFDHARIPLWYVGFWILLVLVVVLVVRLWIVNPLLAESRAIRATLAAAVTKLDAVRHSNEGRR